MILTACDLGSAHLGLVDLVDSPLEVLDSVTLSVDPACLGATVDAVIARVVKAKSERLVLEHQVWFPRAGASAGGLYRSHAEWLVTYDLVREISARSPVPVVVIARQTWAHRVVPHHRGGITDAHVLTGLERLLGADVAGRLADRHQRDAVGAGLGWLLQPAPKEPRTPAGPRAPRSQAGRPRSKSDAWILRRAEARQAARATGGCTCPTARRHRLGCPMAAPSKI